MFYFSTFQCPILITKFHCTWSLRATLIELSDDRCVAEDDGDKWQHELGNVSENAVYGPPHALPGLHAAVVAVKVLCVHVEGVGRREGARQDVDHDDASHTCFDLHSGPEGVENHNKPEKPAWFNHALTAGKKIP